MNNILYEWNPVYNFVMQIKREFENKFGAISYEKIERKNAWGGKKTLTCVENWAEQLNNEEFIKRLQPLEINQNGTFVLFRYANHTSSSEGENEVNVFDNEFWDLYDGFYKECRSVVIDVEREAIVVAPFKKFMNLNQTEKYSLENVTKRIKEATCVEISTKIDGSMQCVNFYEGEYVMTGAQAVDKEYSWRLQDGYNRFMEDENLKRMVRENPNFTFIFEYVALKDAHVVIYTKEQEGLYLIGIRDKITGRQLPYNYIIALGLAYKIKLMTDIHNETLEDVLNNLDTYKSNEAEGVVLYIDGFMVKVKYNDYTQVHRLLSMISAPNLIIEAVADGWIDDLISKVPNEYKWRVEVLVNLLFEYIRDNTQIVEKYFKDISSKYSTQKDFMVEVSKTVPKKYQHYVRNLWNGKDNYWLKTQVTSDTPHYRNLEELGLTEEYSKRLKKRQEEIVNENNRKA